MLNRQRVLLRILGDCARPVSHLELTKLSFLLGMETPSRGGTAFYDFLPYHYGPFSFCLYREMAGLVRDGFVCEPDDRTWLPSSTAPASASRLPARTRRDISTVVRAFGGKPVDETVDYVYGRYGWFTINSRRGKRQRRPEADPAVYTVGYEKQSVDMFLNTLLRHGIGRVVDVRRNAVARRYGFHGTRLHDLCQSLGIHYVHVPELGIPSEERRGLRTPEDFRALFERYERVTLRRERSVLSGIAEMMWRKPTALLCSELDPAMCHRSRVARFLSAEMGLAVQHLEPCK